MMPRYNVMVTRDVTESATVLVDADSPADAELKAVQRAKEGGLYWEADEGNIPEPYVADPGNAAHETPPRTCIHVAVLTDPATGKPLNVRIDAVGNLLNIHPAGYDQPVSLDFHNGRLRVLVNADKNVEEPQIIDLEGAKRPDDAKDEE
jgi:hypothetical protein